MFNDIQYKESQRTLVVDKHTPGSDSIWNINQQIMALFQCHSTSSWFMDFLFWGRSAQLRVTYEDCWIIDHAKHWDNPSRKIHTL